MLKKKLKRIIIIALMAIGIFVSGVGVKASAGIQSYILNKENIVYSQDVGIKENIGKGKILIYHSHTCEKIKDASIVDVGEDLSKKLRSKGYMVEHIIDDFSKDYNNSYHASRAMLKTKDLRSYDLIIDLHTDSGENPTTTTVKDKDIARYMFVSTKQNPYRSQELAIAKGISNKLSEFSKSITKDVFEIYERGISYYNCDMSPNMILMEAGNNQNTFLQCKLTNTYMSAAIDNYINSLK